MPSPDQFIPTVVDLIDTAETEYVDGASVQAVNRIPAPDKTPQRNNHWLRVPDVISVFVDMKGSTELSAVKHDKSTAELYQFFTDTIVRILHEFGASYIDVKGDGVFGLFNSDLPHTALAGAVTCKTFSAERFAKKARTKRQLDLDCHIGIDQKTVLVKRVGIEPRGGDDSHLRNEVWAGKPVNMSAKLAALAGSGQLFASDRFYHKLNDSRATLSCGCDNFGERAPLWKRRDVSDEPHYDFDYAYLLKSHWCSRHGREYCEGLIKSEENAIREAVANRRSGSALLIQ